MGEEKRQAWTGHREAGVGLPAAEERLRAGPVGVEKKLCGPSCSLQKRLRAGPVREEKRQASDRPQRGRGRPAGSPEKKLCGPSCGLQKRLRAGPVGEEKRQAAGFGQATERPGQACRLPRSV